MVAMRMRHQDMTRMISSQVLRSDGVAGFLVRNGSINRSVPPGDMISKAAWPSQVIEMVFFSLGDDVGDCAHTGGASARTRRSSSRMRTCQCFIDARPLQIPPVAARSR